MVEEQKVADFDEIWNHLPHASFYQMRILSFAGYLGIVAGFMAIYPVFAQYAPPSRCETVFDQNAEFNFLTWDEIEELTTNTPDCFEYTKPDKSGCSYCNFTIEDINTCADKMSFDGLIACTNATEFQSNSEWEDCESFTFDRSINPDFTTILYDKGAVWETAVTQFELVCDLQWFNALLTSMGLLGLFFGAFIAGIYTDKFGRKNAIHVWNGICMLCLIAHSFMPDKYGFLIFRAIGNGANHVAWIAYITYSIEVLGPSRRSIAGSMTHVYFSVGYMSSSLLGYLLPDWRGYTMAIAILTSFGFLTIPFFPKSPRFLFSKNRYAEGRVILKTLASKTNSELSEKYLDEFEKNLKSSADIALENNVQSTFSILDLFKYRQMGLVAINIALAFLVNTLVYYGLSFNVDSLAGSLYVNNVINGAVELLAYIVVILLLDTIGRKFMLGGCMILGGSVCLISMLLTQFATEDTSWMLEMAKWLSFLGKFAISGSFCVLYVFSAELFPTEVRSIGIGFGSMIGRIGGMIAPFIILLQDTEGLEFLPYLIFGIGGVVSGVFALFLPETGGQPILQTIEEAVAFYSGKKVSEEAESVEENGKEIISAL